MSRMQEMIEQDNILHAVDTMHSFDQAVEVLKESIRASMAQPVKTDHHARPTLKTFSVKLDTIDSLEWLYLQDLYPRIYWMNREKNFTIAGIGQADILQLDSTGPNDRSFSLLQQSMDKKDPLARYFGGFCFNNEQQQEPFWSDFKSYVFVLPLIEIETGESGTTLTCRLLPQSHDDVRAAANFLIEALSTIRTVRKNALPRLPEVLNVSYSPDQQQWLKACGRVLDTIRTSSMEKVMLARQTHLEFSGKFSPLLFLLKYPYGENSTYRFYFEPRENHAFFSFSPERLYRRDHDMLMTEALAGTVTKETIKGDDNDASALLLNSEKDIREHRFVIDSIKSELQPICSRIDMEQEVKVLHLNRLAHLYTRCSARLKPECSNDSMVLSQLHPTPAVGGVPTGESMKQIMSVEPFSRGWYAGPVGWLSHDAAEFAVGIRSALVSGDQVYLYSGAGLVDGSNPSSEWDEVDQKIGDILAITQQTI
jgi:menaquinone-specific isochorismate synthase